MALKPTSVAVLIAALLSLSGYVGNVSANGGEEGEWFLSHYVSGDLLLTPDHSLPQWQVVHEVHVETTDGEEMKLMSVNNGTYIIFFMEREISTSIDKVGVLIAFEGAGGNDSDEVWAWMGGQKVSPADQGVRTDSLLADSELLVVFGRSIAPGSGSVASFEVGKPEEGFLKATSWTDGSDPSSIDVEALEHLSFELLPPLDLYPKAPIVYSIVFVVAAFSFILAEYRRHH